MSQSLSQPVIYTEDDYYSLPENVRAELIHGQFYNMAAPSRIHQKILMELSAKLHLYADAGVREYWIVNPKNQTVLVYFFEQTAFNVRQFTFHDKIKAGIYKDLWIDFKELDI